MVELAIKKGSKLLVPDKYNNTVLHVAAEKHKELDFVGVLQFLKDCSKNTDLFSEALYTKLFIHFCQKNEELVECGLLLIPGWGFKTPLHDLCINGAYSCLKVCGSYLHRFRNKFGYLPCPMDSYGLTPLHYAFREGHTDIILFLIKLGANIFSVDQFSRSPIAMQSDKISKPNLEKILKEISLHESLIVKNEKKLLRHKFYYLIVTFGICVGVYDLFLKYRILGHKLSNDYITTLVIVLPLVSYLVLLTGIYRQFKFTVLAPIIQQFNLGLVLNINYFEISKIKRFSMEKANLYTSLLYQSANFKVKSKHTNSELEYCPIKAELRKEWSMSYRILSSVLQESDVNYYVMYLFWIFNNLKLISPQKLDNSGLNSILSKYKNTNDTRSSVNIITYGSHYSGLVSNFVALSPSSVSVRSSPVSTPSYDSTMHNDNEYQSQRENFLFENTKSQYSTLTQNSNINFQSIVENNKLTADTLRQVLFDNSTFQNPKKSKKNYKIVFNAIDARIDSKLTDEKFVSTDKEVSYETSQSLKEITRNLVFECIQNNSHKNKQLSVDFSENIFISSDISTNGFKEQRDICIDINSNNEVDIIQENEYRNEEFPLDVIIKLYTTDENINSAKSLDNPLLNYLTSYLIANNLVINFFSDWRIQFERCREFNKEIPLLFSQTNQMLKLKNQTFSIMDKKQEFKIKNRKYCR